MKRLKLAVVGVGHLGKEHARILAGMPDVELVGVVDANQEQAKSVASRHGAQAFTDHWPLLNLVDAACIVVPTSLHAGVSREFLKRGIPLLVEKPIAATLDEAREMVELSQKHDALIQVGHIERFNPAFEALLRHPMQPKYLRAQRLGPFTGRSTDVGVTLDLMIHDLDLILKLMPGELRSVSALGATMFGKHEDWASARLEFADGCVADVLASRAHPTPSRVMQVWGVEGYAEVDFGQRKLSLLQPSKLVQEQGLDPARLDPASRARIRDELFTRHLETQTIDGQQVDQLTAELKHFLDCVRTGTSPRITGEDGRKALAVAEAIVQEIRKHPWTLDPAGPHGPLHLPAPHGPLFPHPAQRGAA
jgi:predicted dehydrogenase